jgi:diguanylate cyclase (GGDEF)-like protein/PAS domain S-box-containing protein
MLNRNANNGKDSDAFENGRMLSTLMGNLDGMVYRCRNDAYWTMEFVSEGCSRLTGYEPEDLLDNRRVSYEEITYPGDRWRVREKIEEALRHHRRFDLEYRITRADGEIRWVWERGIGIFDGLGRLEGIEGFIQDVTERRETEQAIREAERRYRSIFENAIEGIFQSTVDGHYIDVNPALARIYGYASPRELIDSMRDLQRQLYVHPERRDEFLRLVRRDGSVANFESQVYRKNGEIIWISENAREVCDEQGRLLFFEGTVEDISERKRHQAELEYQATHDALTGLPNRVLLRDRIRHAIGLAERGGTLLAVAFIDLDQFKFINDSIGHQAGDDLLKTVAGHLQSCIRETDTVARQGGDEFVILLVNQPNLDTIRQVLQRILFTVASPWRYDNLEFNITCSIGVSVFPNDGADAEALLKNADSAMYKAKETGRNNLQFFTPEIGAGITERFRLETRLRAAIADNEFLLFFQPRIDLLSGRIIGAEALIRWRDQGQRMIQPGAFIQLAEETGLILPIGRWVLATACAQMKRWLDGGLGISTISVNISPRQFHDKGLVQYVAQVLEETGLDPSHLELELTENLVMNDAEKFVSVLQAIKRLGVRIAIDDFGTGYSSLSYLKRFPVDCLKIDRSFVRDIAEDSDDAAIVRAVIALGHSLNLAVVAEGVETPGQLGFLSNHECDEVQGYLFGRPMPAEDFLALLEARATEPR